ncbi:hypothetical protein BG36_17595 [Aquamicrobium defluvii]|uniref:Uncharacterized protein n=1 Tax=Aquamicrobium defluvii TaxID=69279 RepID=A0A011U0S8_9HYPH|nr:hypothetical protein BG36_17595 [Aquamicrobium defluvii]
MRRASQSGVGPSFGIGTTLRAGGAFSFSARGGAAHGFGAATGVGNLITFFVLGQNIGSGSGQLLLGVNFRAVGGGGFFPEASAAQYVE